MWLHEIRGNQLKQARHMMGLSRSKLAKRIGIKDVTIGSWEAAAADVPNARIPNIYIITSFFMREGFVFTPDGNVRRSRGAADRHQSQRTAERAP